MQRAGRNRRVDVLGGEIEEALVQALESEGFPATTASHGPDLVAHKADEVWIVTLKVATAARGDALEGRLAAAILESSYHASLHGGRPLPVVGVLAMSPRQIDRLYLFAG